MTRSTIATKGRAALMALVIGGTAFTAVPVQAQEFGFGFSFGNGGSYYDYYDDYRPRCMSDRQIRWDLRDRGYRNIQIYGGGRYVELRARKGGYAYRITYDACRGRIVSRSRIRH